MLWACSPDKEWQRTMPYRSDTTPWSSVQHRVVRAARDEAYFCKRRPRFLPPSIFFGASGVLSSILAGSPLDTLFVHFPLDLARLIHPYKPAVGAAYPVRSCSVTAPVVTRACEPWISTFPRQDRRRLDTHRPHFQALHTLSRLPPSRTRLSRRSFVNFCRSLERFCHHMTLFRFTIPSRYRASISDPCRRRR